MLVTAELSQLLRDVLTSRVYDVARETPLDKAPRLSERLDNEVLLKREDLGSTGIGKGVAIPHVRLPDVPRPYGLLARLRQPIEFDAIDGQAVDIVFVLLLPANAESAQLGALALVARTLRPPENLVRLRSAKTASELYAAIA